MSGAVLYERIRRAIGERRQVLMVYDQDARAQALDYSRVPLHLSPTSTCRSSTESRTISMRAVDARSIVDFSHHALGAPERTQHRYVNWTHVEV